MKHIKLIPILAIVLSQAYGWYPDYTILATDFQIRQDYLAPTRIHSIGLMGLGKNFVNIYNSPLDNVFQNPAYMSYVPDNYVYLDLASEEFEPQFATTTYPRYGYGIETSAKTSYFPDPYYHSATESSEGKEPIFRAVYFGKTPILPFRFGITAEYFYNEEDFYRPSWYYGGWMRDAMGADYSSELIDPYEDYRLVEAGTNTETNSGYRFNGFLALPLFEWLSLGLGATLHLENADGTYRDMDHRDDSDWADEYLRHTDSYRNRTQTFDQDEVRAGLIWSPKKTTRFGLSVGFTPGTLDRSSVVTDSSNYISIYKINQPDSSIYRSHGGSDNTQNWNYDGNSVWATLHGDITLSDGLLLRFSAHAEKAGADLTESENYYKGSYYYSSYWRTYDDTSYRRISESESWATMNRIGRGEFSRNHQRISIGVDWTISPSLRFVGGASLDHQNLKQKAEEPFIGEKYSHRHYEGYDWYNYSDKTNTKLDDKQFTWRNEQNRTSVAIPIGVLVGITDNIEFQIGLTKVMEHVDVDESYDLVVYHESSTTTVDGVVTIEEDSAYVEGHEFPGEHYFANKYHLNAGVSIKHKDRFKLTAVITESILEPRSLKIGAQILW